MKISSILIASLGLATVAVPSVASAAPWLTINQRQANIYSRIDQGIRSGALTRAEAARVKTQFRTLAALEARYRRTGGFTLAERRDLDKRFTTLRNRIRIQKNDAQSRN